MRWAELACVAAAGHAVLLLGSNRPPCSVPVSRVRHSTNCPAHPVCFLQELNRGADVAQNLERMDEVDALVDAATGSRRTAMQLAPAYPIE